MNDRARAEKEQRFEESMRHQVEDGGGVGSHSTGQKHVAELRDGGVSKHALDVGLRCADGGSENCSECADKGHNFQSVRSVTEDGTGARNHVNAGSDHGGGVNEC